MDAQKILTADILDIIFEGRNKMYGAYHLRRTYNDTLIRAVLICIGLIALLWSGLYLFAGEPVKKMIFTIPGNTSAPTGKIKPPEKKPAEKSNRTKQKIWATPVITDDKKVKDTLHELRANDIIGNITINSPDTIHKVQTKISTFENSIVKKSIDSISLRPDIEASFPGGVSAWRKYLERNLNGQAGVDNGIPTGTYAIMVHFEVSIDGSISNVTAETNYGYGLEAEAVKIIRDGPKWLPAMRNGVAINAYRRQPVLFVITEE